MPFDETKRGLRKVGKTVKRLASGIPDTRKALKAAGGRVEKVRDTSRRNPIAKAIKRY